MFERYHLVVCMHHYQNAPCRHTISRKQALAVEMRLEWAKSIRDRKDTLTSREIREPWAEAAYTKVDTDLAYIWVLPLHKAVDLKYVIWTNQDNVKHKTKGNWAETSKYTMVSCALLQCIQGTKKKKKHPCALLSYWKLVPSLHCVTQKFSWWFWFVMQPASHVCSLKTSLKQRWERRCRDHVSSSLSNSTPAGFFIPHFLWSQ